MTNKNLFHLAFPVNDLDAAREFYGGLLGCPEGRSSDAWIDFDLYGHQIVAHLAEGQSGIKATNNVDADHVRNTLGEDWTGKLSTHTARRLLHQIRADSP